MYKKLLLIFIIFLSLISSVLAAVDITAMNTNIQGQYKMENLSDDVNGLNVTNSGASSGATGIIDDAYDFEESEQDYMVRAMPTEYDTNIGSISFWIKPESNAYGNVVAKDKNGASGTDWFAIQYSPSADETIRIIDRPGLDWTVSDLTCKVGSWCHVVAMSDGSAWYTYINGTNSSVTINGANVGSWFSDIPGTHFRIGAVNSNALEVEFDGIIDEITIFNYTLSEDDITFLYNSGAPGSNQQYVFTEGAAATLELQLNYPTNETHYNLGDYNGSIIVEGTDNLTACTINDSNWLHTSTNLNVSLFDYNGTVGEGNYSIFINCTSVNNATANISFNFLIDLTDPVRTLYSPSNNSFHNTNFTINLTYYDTYLYRTNTTIYYPNGSVAWNNYSGDLSGVSFYNITELFNITGRPGGGYILRTQAADPHTAQYLPPADNIDIDNDYKKIDYTFDDIDIGIQLVGGTKLEEFNTITTTKLIDRYTFSITYNDFVPKNTISIIRLTSNHKINYLEWSPYQGHFIINNKWVDFAGPNIEITVTRIDDYTYDIEIKHLEAYKTLEFQSLGGLNEIDLNTTFIIDTTLPYVTSNSSSSNTNSVTLNLDTSENVTINYTIGTACNNQFNNGTKTLSDSFSITESSLNATTTYYINTTLIDQAGNINNSCFGITTTNVTIMPTNAYLYLTTRNIQDTFQFYNYTPINLFNYLDPLGSELYIWDLQSNGYHDNGVQGNGSLNLLLNISLSAPRTAGYLTRTFIPIDVTNSNYVSFNLYLNSTDGLNCLSQDFAPTKTDYTPIYITLGGGLPTGDNYYFLSCDELNAGWNNIIMDLDNPDHVNLIDFNHSNLRNFQIYFNNNNTKNIEIKVDNLYAYNSTLNTRYTQTKGSWYLEKYNNSYSYNTTAYTVYNNLSTYSSNNLSLTLYNEFETIVKVWKGKDFGSDNLTLKILSTTGTIIDVSLSGNNSLTYYNGTEYNNITTDTDIEDYYWFRIILNNSIVSVSYSRNGSTWTSLDSHAYTTTPNKFVMDCKQSQCYYDNLLIREFTGVNEPKNIFYPSFLYFTQNESNLYTATVEWVRNDNILYTDVFTYPSDYTNMGRNIQSSGDYYINITLCDIGGTCITDQSQIISIGLANFNISIYDEITEALINQVVLLEFISTDYSNNYTATNGTLEIFDLPVGNYEIRYNSNGYDPREYYVSVSAGETKSISLYLLNSTFSDLIILTLFDQDGDVSPNITIKLQRNYIQGNASIFKTVSMTKTNFEGQGGLYVELYDVWYRLIYETPDGTIIKITDPSPFFVTNPEDIINLEEDIYLSWRNYDSVYGNVTFINDSGTIYARFIYNDNTNLVRIGCLRVQRMTLTGVYDVCNTCVSSASATISCAIDPTLDGEYKAVGTIDTNTTNSWYVLDSEFFKLYNTITYAEEGLFMSGIFVGSLTLIGVGSIFGSLLLLILGVIAVSVLGWVAGFSIANIYWVVILAFIVIFIIRRRQI